MKIKKNIFSGSTLLAWLMSMLLVIGSVWQVAEADQTNLLTNPVLQPGNGSGTLPSGWTHQGWVPDGTVSHAMGSCPNAYLCAAYSYGSESVGGKQYQYMDVLIKNTSGLWAYTNLFMGEAIAASVVDNYRVVTTARVITVTGNSKVSLGFHLYDSAGYVNETGTDLLITKADQLFSHNYQAGLSYGTAGRIPTSIQPRLSIYLPPGATITVRIKLPTLIRGQSLSSVGIDARTSYTRTLTAAPGKALVFTAGLKGRTLNPVQARVTLVPATGTLTKSFQHTVSSFGSGDPDAGDAWKIILPSDINAGSYSIRYSLLDEAGDLIPLQTESDVFTIDTAGIYQIGWVSVNANAGLAIGQHFHGHPGRIGGNSRGTDPILVPYHFVRSHDSENVGGTSWWVGDGQYNWTEFDRWANFHAKSNQKKLLITFFGSPTWASSKPTETSIYGANGLAAPPNNLTSYQNMVTATVSRYKDRIFAVECWNEPDVTGFFTGTGTQLADICKAIYKATKSVSVTKPIPVICPSANDQNWLLTLKTTQGEKLSGFCDWVGGHPYNFTGTDPAGNAYSLNKLGDYVEGLETILRGLNLQKQIAITEWGIFCEDSPAPAHPIHFHDMSSADRADLLYQTLLKAQEKGLVALGLYSYDSGDSATCKYGLEGISSGNDSIGYSYDAVTAAGVTKAVQDVGKPLP
jgi:hypothetical protein